MSNQKNHDISSRTLTTKLNKEKHNKVILNHTMKSS
jgi:hypothetical protein